MELRPQDIVVVLKLLPHSNLRSWTYATLAEELCMSSSQVFRSVQRAVAAHLLEGFTDFPPPPGRPAVQSGVLRSPNRGNLREFLVHGVQYAFPAHRGGPTRGIPTAEAAAPLNRQIMPPPPSELPPVWPFAEGNVRGIEFSPLYKNVPKAAMRDPKLYELLALTDAIRNGRAREREIAVRELTSRIDSY